MSKYSIKFPQDDRYFSDERIYITNEQITLLEHFTQENLKKCIITPLSQSEIEFVHEFLDVVHDRFEYDKEMKSNNYWNSAAVGGYYYDVPFKKVMETEEVNYHGKSLEETIEAGIFAKNELSKMTSKLGNLLLTKITQAVGSGQSWVGNTTYLDNPYAYLHMLVKNITYSVPRNFPKTVDEAIIVEDDEFTQYVERKAYAIFMKASRNGEKEGFFGGAAGAKKIGCDLANARTFNSAKIAEKYAKQNHYYMDDNYAIVEVSMRMNRVVSYKKPIEKLDAALSMIEKERIEKFFEENSLEVIEAKLNELKLKQAQIIQEKKEAKSDYTNETSLAPKKRNKI